MTDRLKHVVGLFAVAGCSPPAPPPFVPEADSVAVESESTCSTAFACSCPFAPWPDEEACLETETMRNLDVQMVAAEAGLTYDGVCVGHRQQQLTAIECAAEEIDEERDAACAEACKTYVGTIGEGDTCQRFGVTVDLDDCAQGLRCDDLKTCVPLCEVVEVLDEGDRCMAGIDTLGACAVHLHCDAEEGRCRVAAAIGEPCDELPCAGDAVCDAAQQPRTCVPKQPAGEACIVDDWCISGLCIDDTCAGVVPLSCGI